MISLNDVIGWFLDTVWFPLITWVSDTFNVTPTLAMFIVFFVMAAVASVLNENRRKSVIRQAISESKK